MLTLKLKYKCFDEEYYDILQKYMLQYSSCLHYLYNRLSDNNGDISEKDLRTFTNISINNINLLDSWFKQSCVKESIALYKSFKTRYNEHESNREYELNKLEFKHNIHKISDTQYSKKKKYINSHIKLIFGGKQLNSDRTRNKISKETYKKHKLNPISSIGESQFYGNRKFKLNEDLTILFKPSNKLHFTLQLNYGQNQKNILCNLLELSLYKSISLSYKLDNEYIYISYDESLLNKLYKHNSISNRILAIDMNPNYIGWSIVDWKSSSEFNVINSGVYSTKQFSDEYKNLNKLGNVSSDDLSRIYLNNKRSYETVKIAQNIISKAIYYKCQIISIEDLNIKSKDKDKGKSYNALCNNHWLRNVFVNQLIKLTNLYKIQLLKVKPEYSSFIGNFLYRSLQLPDMVLSSIEIGRRGYEFYNQYITKTKNIKKNIIQPDINDFINFYKMSLEELNIEFNKNDMIKLYNFIKSKKDHPIFKGDPNKVRIQLQTQLVKRFFSIHSYVYI